LSRLYLSEAASQGEVPFRPSPTMLLAKALQDPVMHPDLLASERFGPPQSLERLRWKPSLHAENHDLPQPSARGGEFAFERDLRRRSPPYGKGGEKPSEGRSDQLRDAVPAKDDSSEAPSDDGEKKGGGDGVFHWGSPI
jgi:hypothetical protein